MTSPRHPALGLDIPTSHRRPVPMSQQHRTFDNTDLSRSAPCSQPAIRRKPSVIEQYVSHVKSDPRLREEHRRLVNNLNKTTNAAINAGIALHSTSLPLTHPTLSSQKSNDLISVSAQSGYYSPAASPACINPMSLRNGQITGTSPSTSWGQRQKRLPVLPLDTFPSTPATSSRHDRPTFGHDGKGTTPLRSKEDSMNVPPELAHLNRDFETRPRAPPSRPSRAGVPPLSSAPEATARAPSSSFSPSTSPEPSSRPTRSRSSDRLVKSISSTSLKACSMLGKLLNIDDSTSPKLLKHHKRPRKGPAAGTGHEGYGRFASCGRNYGQSYAVDISESSVGSPKKSPSPTSSRRSPRSDQGTPRQESGFQPHRHDEMFDTHVSPINLRPEDRRFDDFAFDSISPIESNKSAGLPSPMTTRSRSNASSAFHSRALDSIYTDSQQERSWQPQELSALSVQHEKFTPASGPRASSPVYELPARSPVHDFGEIPVFFPSPSDPPSAGLMELNRVRFELEDNSPVSSSVTTRTSILEGDSYGWHGDEEVWDEYNDILGLTSQSYDSGIGFMSSKGCRTDQSHMSQSPKRIVENEHVQVAMPVPQAHSAEVSNTQCAAPAARDDLRLGALMTGKWLYCGRAMLSPIEKQLHRSPDKKILIIDGICDDWSIYCALSYPGATVYNLQPLKASYLVLNSGTTTPIPSNHRTIRHASPAAPYPFPQDFFDAVVYRLPTISSQLDHDLSESKRVVRPGGYVEITSVDIDMMSPSGSVSKMVRELKMDLQEVNGHARLGNVSDSILRLVGQHGFENIQRCMVGIPAAGHVDTQQGESTERRESEHDLASLLRNANSGNESEDDVANMVARVGRWWYSHCYEGVAESLIKAKGSIWDRPGMLEQSERAGTPLRMLMCFAQKPIPQGRAASL